MCGLVGILCATRSTTRDSGRFHASHLRRIVGEQPDPVDPERAQHRRRMAIVALVIGEAQPQIRFDGVETAVLQRIGADFVDEADAAALLAEVQQHAAACLANDAKRLAELGSAIALQ